MKKTAKIVLSFLLLVVVAVCFCSCSLTESDDKEKYTVTVVNGTGGGSYEKGSDVTVTADVKEGKVFASWNEGESVVSTDNPYTFKAEKDVTLTAVYTEAEKVTVTVENAEGSGEFYKGSNVTLNAPEVAGKRFVGWKVADETVSSDREYTFVANTDVTVTATYVNVYTLTVEGGTGSGTYDEGTVVTLTATVDAGKRFVAWKSGVITLSENAEFTVTVDKDMTIVAETVNVYTVTVEGGTGSGTYDEGATVSVTATVPENKAFVKWVDGNNETLSTSKTYEFAVRSDVTVKAVLEDLENFNLTIDKNEYFEEGSSAFVYENGDFKISDANIIGATLPYAYDSVDVSFVLYGGDNWGNPSGNLRVYVGEGYCFYYSIYYKYMTLLGAGESENEPVASAKQEYTERVKYRLSYADGILSLYYAKYVDGAFEDETLLRSVPYAEENVKIRISSYASCVRMSDLKVSYAKPQFKVNNYTVTVENGEGGGTYRETSLVTVSANASLDKVFVRWEDGDGNAVSSLPEYTFLATKDVTLTAVYANMVTLNRAYTTLTDIGSPTSGYSVESENVYKITSGGSAVTTLPHTYDNFEMTFVMFGTGDYGDPSGNFRLYIGNTYCYYFRALYNFAGLLGTGEDENNPVGNFKHEKADKVRYRIVYKNGSLSLYYAKYDGETLGEETLARTVEYAKQERAIKFSCYKAEVKITDFAIKYEKPEFEVGNYTVTVEGGTGSGTYREDQKATVTLDAGTENFVKWVDGNGNVLSKEESFSFYPTADITVTAVCAGKVEKTKVYATKEDLGTTAEGVTDENGVITINRNSVLQFTLAETYDEFELSFDMFGTNNYGDPSGNFRLYIGDTYCYYFRAPYNFAALLGTGEDENNPPNFFKHYDTDKVRYRIVYKDGSLSLYYAKYTDGVLGEETLARTVEYAKQEREIKFSFYQVVVSLENFTVKYMAVEE